MLVLAMFITQMQPELRRVIGQELSAQWAKEQRQALVVSRLQHVFPEVVHGRGLVRAVPALERAPRTRLVPVLDVPLQML